MNTSSNTLTYLLMVALSGLAGWLLCLAISPPETIKEPVPVAVPGPVRVERHTDTVIVQRVERVTKYERVRSSVDSVLRSDTTIAVQPTISRFDTLTVNGDTVNIAHQWPESAWWFEERPRLRLDTLTNETQTVYVSVPEPRKVGDDVTAGAIGAAIAEVVTIILYLILK